MRRSGRVVCACYGVRVARPEPHPSYEAYCFIAMMLGLAIGLWHMPDYAAG
jgi:hypothetical protein